MKEINNKKTIIPIISIICPTYNHEPYIRQALNSILMQETEYDYEILIGEDCSTDNSKEILKEYSDKYPNIIKVFNRKSNMGATKNGYDLYMRARGKYIALLELDDYWTDEKKLQKQVAFLESNPEIIGCAHDSIMIDDENTQIKETLTDGKSGELTLNDFICNGFTFQSGALVYRNFFSDGGDYSVLYRSHCIAGDITVNSILLSRGNIYLMKDKMSAYRRVIKRGGTSAASIAYANEAKSLLDGMNQLEMLDVYFNGEIDFTPRMIYPMERYITGVLRRESGFNLGDYLKMRKIATMKARKRVLGYVISYPLRRLKNIFGW